MQFFSPPSSDLSNTFETIEWFDTLDTKCKLEAILAGHVHPSPHIRPIEYPVQMVNLLTQTASPHEVVVVKRPPQSPLIRSCQNGIRYMAKTSQEIVCKQPKPETPSRYKSPSPDTLCCGLLYNGDQREVFYV
jgi:hypothetical protein